MYERKLRRWSRACGIVEKDQGDIILLYPSVANPDLHERLDREIGEKVVNNTNCIDLIITTLKSWFGISKGVDLMKVFNDFITSVRTSSQDLHLYIAEFEGKYNQLEKLGEKLSPRLLALFLLKNANLSDTEFQIITANLNFSTENEEELKQLFEQTKDALNKHQNCRVINSNKSQESSKTFLVDAANLESLTEEQQNELVLWLKKKNKLEQSSDDQPPQKKWRKCYHCLCDCQPKWKKCECLCSQHPHWKCPNKPKKPESGAPSATAVTSSSDSGKLESNLSNLNSYLSNDIKKIPSAKEKTNNRETVQLNHQLTLLANKKNALSGSITGNKHQMTIDTACPTALVGAKLFKKIYQSYPQSIASSQFKSEPSNKTFQFGGGETTVSLGKYTFPVFLMDESNEMHGISLIMEIVEQDIIMLLGSNSLTKAGTVLDLGNLHMTLPTLFGDTKFPLRFEDTGHFSLDFYNLTKEDGYTAAQTFLAEESWTQETASSLLNFVKFKKRTEFKDVAQRVYFTKKSKGQAKPNLNQKDINKLHHLFGHAHPDRLEGLIKTAGRWNEKVKEMLKKVSNCEVCKIEGRRIPKPKVSLPRAARHNHVVAADLKENTRYPNAPPYILYMVDCFSRFKCAAFIPDKNASTVTEAIIVNWIKLFGPMKYLHVDRGREWLNQELQTMCFKFDIRLTATAAQSPNQNGIVERQHAVCDRMMDKMITADPSES